MKKIGVGERDSLWLTCRARGVKQRGELLDTAECNHRYERQLNTAVLSMYPFLRTVTTHGLRSLYVAYALHLYSSNVTMNLAAMRMLGHEKLEVSLSYNSVLLHDTAPAWQGCYGALP